MPRLPAHIAIDTNCHGPSVAAINGERGVICIDTPLLSSEADSWRRKLQGKNLPVAYVVQMDSAPDRAFAASHLSAIYEGQSPILLAHMQTVDAMKTLQDSFKNNPLLSTLEASYYNLDPLSLRWPRPTMAFSREMTMHWEPTLVVLRHMPSTTPGACWVHLPEEKILFVGDAVSTTLPPTLQDVHFETWLASLVLLRHAPYKDSRLFCSHGGWIGAEDVSRFVNFLRLAQRKIAAIREKADPQKDIPLAAQSMLEFFSFPSDRKEFLLRRMQVSLRSFWEREHVQAMEKPGAG
jgi:glyoxylase-like metal-dependent hydrolase (beta-lactamase superfamily II)